MLPLDKPVMLCKKPMISYFWNGSINTLFQAHPLRNSLPLWPLEHLSPRNRKDSAGIIQGEKQAQNANPLF